MNKIITKLTPAQEKRLPEWRREWFAIGSSTEPADRPRAEAAINQLYAHVGFKQPTYYWMNSPIEAAKFLKQNGKKTWETPFWGQTEVPWVNFYKFAEDVLKIKFNPDDSKWLNVWAEITKSMGWWWPFENVVVACERPEIIKWEPDRDPPRLHCVDGPSVRFRDGWELYHIRNVKVEKRIVMDPTNLAIEEITGQQNAEVRRIMIQRYGEDRFLTKVKAKLIDDDEKEGMLYSFKLKNGEEQMLLRVVNSSPEPDGTFKVVFLDVPSNVQQANETSEGKSYKNFRAFREYKGPWNSRAARAWTFDIHPDDFNLHIET